ncbi:thioredoxin family protein [Haloferula helveola]
MAETLSTFSLKPGDAAPEFELPAADGALQSLTGARGEKGTLVFFACNHCPYVVMLADAIASIANDLADKGIATVAISSNDVENYPQDSPELMASFAKEHGWEFPYLYDESQDVAKAYGAACTPDFFLFDSVGNLYYAGQFDDSRPKNGRQPDGADLMAAVADMLAGRSAPERQLPSSGCNIKWKPGNEPAYFG